MRGDVNEGLQGNTRTQSGFGAGLEPTSGISQFSACAHASVLRSFVDEETTWIQLGFAAAQRAYEISRARPHLGYVNFPLVRSDILTCHKTSWLLMVASSDSQP